MADTPAHPDSLDDLSEAQRDALVWLSSQPPEPVEPPKDHHAQTWNALVKRNLVSRDDQGRVTMLPSGSALFASKAADDATAASEQAAIAQDAAEQATAAAPADSGPADSGPADSAEPAPGHDADAPADEPAASTSSTFGELRPQQTGHDDQGSFRVLGPPEALHGHWEGYVRVLVMRGEHDGRGGIGHRDYLRGHADATVTLD